MKTVKTTGTHTHIPAESQDVPKEERRKKIKQLYHFTLNAFHQAALIRGLSSSGRLWTPSLQGQCWLSRRERCPLKPDCQIVKVFGKQGPTFPYTSLGDVHGVERVSGLLETWN